MSRQTGANSLLFIAAALCTVNECGIAKRARKTTSERQGEMWNVASKSR